MKKLHLSFVLLLSLSLSFTSFPKSMKKRKRNFDMRELILPSDLKDINKADGAIFYNNSIKGKALIPIHVWGEVGLPGLHFIPLETSIIKGLSLAGGPNTVSRLDNIKISRMNENKKLVSTYYDLSVGGGEDAFKETLKAGDTVFVAKDYFRDDRVYYTSLVSVIVSALSGILIYREVKR